MIKKLNLKLKMQSFINGLSYYFKRNSKHNMVALTLQHDEMHAYWLNKYNQPQTASISHQQDWSKLFSQVRSLTRSKHAAITLTSSFYQILTIDKPASQTAKASYHYTILWSIKALVDLPLEDIHLDYFDAYSAHQKEKIHVVVVKKSLLKSIVKAAHEAHIEITKISIEEMVLSYLFEQQDIPRMLLSHCPKQDILLAIYYQHQLISFRRLNGFTHLNTYTPAQIEHDVIDKLSLEIQRSIDLIESQLKLPPIQRIDLLCEGEKTFLNQKLSENFNQPITLLSNEKVLHIISKTTFIDLKHGVEL
tara:strand:- start:4730 stop:5647 length:918 start_codon:yes stop_codon:yes gene_type:complete